MAKLYCSSDAKIVVKIKHQLLFLLKILPICHLLINNHSKKMKKELKSVVLTFSIILITGM